MCSKPLIGTRSRWCSKRCSDRSRYVRRTVPFDCPSCGKRVLIPANKRSSRKFCTRSCATATFNARHLVGSRNGRWRGGHVMTYGAGWKLIRQEVRERDRVCQRCSKTPEQNGRALDVHHVEPFRFSGDNSPDKLIALCRACHMKADDHGRRGSAIFLREAGYRPDIPKRELQRRAARQRALERDERRREARQHVNELAELGLSLRRIARAAGVSHQTVSNWLSDQRNRLVG